jgi:hypothetical protein
MSTLLMIKPPAPRSTEEPAPLSCEACEVLRALVLGLELRGGAGGWAFVGPWQDPTRSGVPSAIMSELFGADFVRHGDGSQIEITDAGQRALKARIDTAWQDTILYY